MNFVGIIFNKSFYINKFSTGLLFFFLFNVRYLNCDLFKSEVLLVRVT